MKTLLSQSSATAFLAKEFARLRSPECRECTVPTPFWAPAPHGPAGLWFLKALKPCPHGCHRVVTRIWVDLTSIYEIEYTPATSAAPRPRREMKVTSRG